MKSRIALFVFTWLATISLVASAAVDAATFTVTKLGDSNDGLCNADCSLREAIRAANAQVGTDTIVLPAGTLTLSIPGRGENLAAIGDLDITSNVEISGQGVGSTTIDGRGIDRVFRCLSPPSRSAT